MALSARKTTWIVSVIAIASLVMAGWEIIRINQIRHFNHAINNALPPATDKDSYEAKFATAYWQASNGKYQEATLLFAKLKDLGDDTQKSAVLYNIGNIYLLRGLAINGRDITVRDQTEYLLTQAKTAYQQSLRLDNNFWDARHNLDRVISMLPATPTPGVGDSDSPGLIMGSIPVGLP